MIRILLNGVNLTEEGNSGFGFIPRVGDELFYRTFRQHEKIKADQIFDYHLKVEKVIYETEESWNHTFRNTFVNIIVSEISKIKIDPETIDFK